MYKDSFKRYLEDLASRKPAPGGGSAAALVGAIGASLISKVANFTIGKEKYKEVEKEMSNIVTHSEQLRDEFNRLSSDDITAYQRLSATFKLPKGSQRQEKVQAALKEAAAVPLQICKDAHEAIKLSLPLAQKGNVNLITDVAIAAILLESAFKSGLLNVEINLKSIKNEKFILKIREVLEPMEKELASVFQEVKTEVEKHIGK